MLAIRGVLAFADGFRDERDKLAHASAGARCSAGAAVRGLAAARAQLRQPRHVEGSAGHLGTARDGSPVSLEERLEVQATALSFRAAGALLERTKIDQAMAAIERRIPSVGPAVQARLLTRLGTTAFYMEDFEKAERFSLDAALLGTELATDTLAAHAYAKLSALAQLNDPDAQRALSFLRSQEAAAERAAQIPHCGFTRCGRNTRSPLRTWTSAKPEPSKRPCRRSLTRTRIKRAMRSA